MPELLEPMLRVYLSTWRPNPQGLLFANSRGRPCDRDRVVKMVLHPILKQLGISREPRCGLHAFRHTHCSLLLDTGASAPVVQEQLRHTDARITLGVYGHVIGDARRVAVDKVAHLILCPDVPKREAKGKWVQ